MVGNIVVCASQIEGRCNKIVNGQMSVPVVCASQIEGRCNAFRYHPISHLVVCAS